jgi:methyltransferase-like protein/SAM-dependent methyltransferase
VTAALYDQVPYPSKPYPETAPARLAVMGRLFGIDTPDPRTARVLEIGCAGGGNLIPHAVTYPEMRLLGIDPSREHVKEAEQLLFALGVDNARVELRGVEDLSAEDGPFDYIIAHGVFSWIAAPLRAALLDRCAALLAPNGVAHISYNTLPGWHMRTMIRDAMLFHAERADGPQDRVARARAMLGFLASSVPAGANPWGTVLASERAVLDHHGDAYLFHDHLSPTNDPIYVRDFIARAEAAGLQYLGESDLSSMVTVDLPARIRQVVEASSQTVGEVQQYLDFLVNRTFRHSLLVRADATVDRTLRAERVRSLFVASPLRRNTEVPLSLAPDLPALFRRGERELETSDPALKAAWAELQERHPAPIAFPAWVEAVRARLDAAGRPVEADLEGHLGRAVLHAVARDLAEVWPHGVALGTGREALPVGAPFAVLQARLGCPWGVTSLRHEQVPLDPFDRHLLAACDGTRSLEDLENALFDAVLRGALVFAPDDGQAAPPEVARAEIRRDLPERLAWLASRALLCHAAPET